MFSAALSDRLLFFRKFLASPRKTGSVTPSSRYLTGKIFKGADWSKIRCIAELGAGTGVFTDYIERHRQSGCKAVIFEQDNRMRDSLMLRYPDMNFAAEAELLPWVLSSLGTGSADLIISGLPFSTLPRSLTLRILGCVRESLAEGGRFVAFQYSPALLPLFRRFFPEVKVSLELRNLPPALIFDCSL
ncbi:MAG: hypothetical protein SPL30_08515 [Succinivibrio sp.]|jgi:phospholipid N-methyltransferase|nr:hypothetical protein [Succinivibrio sp.]